MPASASLWPGPLDSNVKAGSASAVEIAATTPAPTHRHPINRSAAGCGC